VADVPSGLSLTPPRETKKKKNYKERAVAVKYHFGDLYVEERVILEWFIKK
jgi:hypothetical protein